MARSITSANAVFLLAVPGAGLAMTRIQGFAADDAFASDGRASTQSEPGVDGGLAHGYVYAPTKIKVMLMPNSESIDFFQAWDSRQQQEQEAFSASGSITLKGPGKTWELINGGLTTYKPVYDAKKVLQKVEMELTFQRAEPANI